MANLISLGIAVLFGFILTLIYWLMIWWLDRFEKEPIWLLISAFIWGAVFTPIASIVAELIMEASASVVLTGTALDFTVTSGVAPLVEESFKGMGLLLVLIFFKREVDDAMDGLVYGATIGLGFALTENMLYFVGSALTDVPVLLLFFLRSIIFGLTHAVFTGTFGLFLGLGKVVRNWGFKILLGVVGFGLAIGMHAGHNSLVGFTGALGLVASVTMYAITLVVILSVAFAILYYERKWIKKWLAPELANGHINQEMFDRACSWAGLTKELHVLFTRGPGAYARMKNRRHLLAKLALRLQAFHRTGNPEYLKDVEHIREKIWKMAL